MYTKRLDEIDVKNILLKNLRTIDYIKGVRYYPPYVNYKKREEVGDLIHHHLKVESERTTTLYDCDIYVDRSGNIKKLQCSCPQFYNMRSCKHLSAAIINYSDEILKKIVDDKSIENVTKQVFSYLEDTFETRTRKKELSLDLSIDIDHTMGYYSRKMIDIFLYIGLDKKYKCNLDKIRKFLAAYETGSSMYFGKNFTYDPNTQYFNERDKKLLDYLLSNRESGYYSNNNLSLNDYNLKTIIKMMNSDITLNGFKIMTIKDEFPLATTLDKKDGKYILDISDNSELEIITDDLEYIQNKNILYHLDKKKRNLLIPIFSEDLNKMIFDEKDLSSFMKTVLPTIKENVNLKVDNIVIPDKPDVKLYFDFYKDKIVCNLKLEYNNITLDYFDKNVEVVRDDKFEEEVVDDLIRYKFEIVDNRFIIIELEDMVDFLERDLDELSKKYDVYTSEKLKNTNIIKKSKISSTFSIGTDNIMSYSFALGDIKPEEIVNVFKSLENKKKYYRLKSGDILDLEDKNIQELKELSEELDLSNSDLKNETGEIPKYKAIYLDSLKDNKYHIIKTDNLFRELIDKFNKYKDSDITLDKKELKVLRAYQLDGVKWLYNIHKTGFGGILADEMGLGKSIQTIYFFKQLLFENKNSKFLIVAPTSLVYNWEQEFGKFASNLKYKVVIGNKIKRGEILNDLENTNIFITTYGLLREDFESYQDINFEVCVIDEAQNIKNAHANMTKCVKKIKANTKIALTGTPIENSLAELWSIFDFIMPGFLGSLKKFESKYKVGNFDDETNELLSSLSDLVNPFILRRRKKDVIDNLPDKIENNIYVELTKSQKKIYLAELDKVNKEMDEALATGGISEARFIILKLLTKLRQICIDPRILFSNYNGGSGKMEVFTNTVSDYVKGNHKILIFTSFRTALELARENLSKCGITSYVIDGSVSAKKRMELVNKFNEDDTNVFFIMLKSGGTGLNLTGADVVIHLDLWWNPQAENQATDRAHRIGQKNVVEVVKFITKGTIEEKILELQNKKKILSDKLIDQNNGENSFSKLTEKDIKHLLSYENID